MIPIRDIHPTQTRPVITYLLIAANTVVWLYQFSLTAGGDTGLNLFVYQYGMVPRVLLSFEHPGSFFTLFSHMFMHGGWMHFLGNMWFLWVFGDNVEDNLGPGRYIAFYVLSGLGAAAAQAMIDPGSQVPMVGASGAIAGVLAGYVSLFPRARVLTLVPIIFVMFIEVPAFVFIFVWFGMQLLNGMGSLATIGSQAGGVAFFAHIGGFLVGLVLIRLLSGAKHTGGGGPRVTRIRRGDDWRQQRDSYRAREYM